MPTTDLGRSDSESSIQNIIQEMMMSSQFNGEIPFQPNVGETNTGGSLGVNSGLGSDMKTLKMDWFQMVMGLPLLKVRLEYKTLK